MNNDTTPEYRLVRIIDKHSPYKSILARMICYESFRQFGIHYISRYDKELSCCQNTLNCKYTYRCPQRILDIFVLKHIETGAEMEVGNHCIQSLILDGFVIIPDGLSHEDLIRLINNLNNPSIPCIICGENHVSKEWSFHKKCLTNKNNSVVQNKKHCMKELIAREVLSRLMKILKEKYILLYQHTDKLLRLNHNPILDTMKRMKRFPTDKQMRIIEKIINNYNRMKQINDSYSHKDRHIYDRYGFVY